MACAARHDLGLARDSLQEAQPEQRQESEVASNSRGEPPHSVPSEPPTSDSSNSSQPVQDAASLETAASGTSPSTMASTPPSSVESGSRCPMPTEIFVAAARHLTYTDLAAATQVCQSWRRALHSHAPLWRRCSLSMDSDFALDKLKAWCARSNHTLARLHLALRSNAQGWSIEWMHDRMAALRKILLDADGGRQLEYLSFSAVDLSGFAYVALSCFCEHLLRPNPSTGYLCNPRLSTQCDIKVPFYLFPVGQAFLHHFAAVDHVQLVSKPPRILPISDQVEFIKLSGNYLANPSRPVLGHPAAPSQNQSLLLAGVNFLPTLVAPDCSNLCELTLQHCQIGRAFFYMLQSAAPQLESLTTSSLGLWYGDLRDFRPDEFFHPGGVLVTDEEGGMELAAVDEEDLDEWDVARDRYCITLPNLKELRAQGHKMPAWWQADAADQHGQPDIYMPALEAVILHDLDTLDEVATPRVGQSPRRQKALEYQLEAGELPELLEEAGDDELSAVFPPLAALWNITSVAAGLRHLDLSRCVLTDHNLHSALRFAGSLRSLVLCDMPDISDYGGTALCYLPQLQQLDIRGTDINAYTIAKVYEAIRDVGLGRLEDVLMDDPGPFYENEYAYRAHVAYTWLEWIGVARDWQSRVYPRAWQKRPWEDRDLDAALDEEASSLPASR